MRSETARTLAPLAGAALAGALLASSVAAADAPAVLVRRPPLAVPSTLVGLQSTPEVSVRVQVDERGRVADVEVLSIAPPSDFDDLLADAVREQLDAWRFAPATRDAAPVASTVELRVQFRDIPQTREEAVETLVDTFALGEPARRAAELARLTAEERSRVLERYARVAEGHLVASQRRRAESPRFVAVSDARDERVAESLAANLEATWNQFERILGGELEPQPEPYKLVAYLFSSRAAFHATQRELRDGTLGEGFYTSPGFLAFHQESVDPDEILATMVHESFHAYSDRLLRRPGRPGEPWLEEGLAEYFGNSQIKKGELVPGRTLHRKFLMHYGQVFKLQTQAGISVAELKRAVRRGETPALRSLIEASRREFYGEDLRLYYGTAWLLVHFLRHGEPGWAAGEFPRLLLYLYEGYPAVASIEAAYRLGLEEVEERFEDYVRGF